MHAPEKLPEESGCFTYAYALSGICVLGLMLYLLFLGR